MDEKRMEALAERIFQKIQNELDAGTLKRHLQDNAEVDARDRAPFAYIILPERIDGRITARTAACLRQCQGKYDAVVVVESMEDVTPDITENAASVVRRNEVRIASETVQAAVTIVIAASRDLRVKTAHCLAVDFESRWVMGCIENGIPVYMFREEKKTGREPAAYLRKLEEYDRELQSFGIIFDSMPFVKQEKKRRVIAAEDIKMLDDAFLQIGSGDLITELAQEAAREKGIEIIRI